MRSSWVGGDCAETEAAPASAIPMTRMARGEWGIVLPMGWVAYLRLGGGAVPKRSGCVGIIVKPFKDRLGAIFNTSPGSAGFGSVRAADA